MSIEPGVVVGVDRDHIDVNGQRAGLVRGLLQSGVEIEAGFMGTPPWPLAPALFDGGPEWVCLGPLGHRRPLIHDDFLDASGVDVVEALQAWTNYTPTLSQNGTVSKTVTTARYRRLDDIVFVEIDLTVTATGSAGHQIIVGLPLTASLDDNNALAGGGFFYDSSATDRYMAGIRNLSSSTFGLQPGNATAGNVLGVAGFTGALGSGDTINASFWYRAASPGAGTPVTTTYQVDGWITNDVTAPPGHSNDPVDAAGQIFFGAVYPDTIWLRKRDRQITLHDDRVFWISARLRADQGTCRVGLADLGAMDPSTAASANDSGVYAELDPAFGASNHIVAVSGVSSTSESTGEQFSNDNPQWVDVMVSGGQWAAMWVNGAGPWMVNTNVPGDGTRSVTPFVSITSTAPATTALAQLDCVSVEMVSQAVNPYTLGLFSAESLSDT